MSVDNDDEAGSDVSGNDAASVDIITSSEHNNDTQCRPTGNTCDVNNDDVIVDDSVPEVDRYWRLVVEQNNAT